MRQWHSMTPEKKKAYQKARYAANRSTANARSKAYYHANSDKVKAREKARYAANRDKVKAEYQAAPGKYKARAKVYREAQPEKVRVTKKAGELWREYGLTVAEYSILTSQSDTCAICGKEGKLVIDHNHATGRVRGLLCNHCNMLLGCAFDDPEILRNAIAYLQAAPVEFTWPSSGPGNVDWDALA